MYLSNYNIIYLISNVFGTYTVFKFMTIFFQRDNSKKTIEITSYALYYFAIGIIYIVFNIPLLNLFSNLIFFYLLTFNYVSTWKARFSAVVFIYSILIIAETGTIFLMKILDVDKLAKNIDMVLVLSLIFSKIISYIFILAISNFKRLKLNNNISPVHWAAIFLIPLGSMFSTAVIYLQSDQNSYNLFSIISSIILFSINIFVFYLYDVLMKYYEERADRELLIQQNNAYMKQLSLIKQSQENLSILRHDFKFHISSIQTMLENGDVEKAQEYLVVSFNALNNTGEYAKSGNQEVDSILNYKISEALYRSIETEFNLCIPDKLNIQPFDLVAILGNLFDNAIEATSKLKSRQKIKIDIRYDRNILYISFVNPYVELKFEDNKIITTNTDRENHGFGMESVKRAVEKYNGVLEIKQSDNLFYVDAMLYNTSVQNISLN